MITEGDYARYIADFNGCCAAGGGFGGFFDRWYEPDAVFEYIPKAARNAGRDKAVAFWEGVSAIMEETIRPHTRFVSSGWSFASEAPIDFSCKTDLDWVGVPHAAGTTFRLMMAAFYDVSPRDRITCTRVYSVYHPAYRPEGGR